MKQTMQRGRISCTNAQAEVELLRRDRTSVILCVLCVSRCLSRYVMVCVIKCFLGRPHSCFNCVVAREHQQRRSCTQCVYLFVGLFVSSFVCMFVYLCAHVFCIFVSACRPVCLFVYGQVIRCPYRKVNFLSYNIPSMQNSHLFYLRATVA